jgi:GWxTD domain-containing protein
MWHSLSGVAGSAGHSVSLAKIAPWLAPLWLVGVILIYARSLAGSLALRRMRQRGVCSAASQWKEELGRLAMRVRVSRSVELLESCFADAPIVIGHFRPVILVPLGLLSGLPATQIETILLHELAHIRRHDFLVNSLQRLVEGLLFYHPALWWISSVMRRERENCCDDAVVAIHPDKQEYARALAALEHHRIVAREAAIAATGGSLMKRIHRLLSPEAPKGMARVSLLGAALLVATLAFSAAAYQSESQQKSQAQAAPQLRQQSQPASQPPLSKLAVRVTEGSEIRYHDGPREFQPLNHDLDGKTIIVFPQLDPPQNTQPQETQAKEQAEKAALLAEAAEKQVEAEKEARDAETTQVQGKLDAERQAMAARVQSQRDALAAAEARHYEKWLNEDVVYIIDDAERGAYLGLKTDEERNDFIQSFWDRRNPTPGSAGNAFEEEHYRRIGYANQHFAGDGIEGWRTDRGHIYIVYGPPDEIDSHPTPAEGTVAKELWLYRQIEGLGDNLTFTFADRTGHGDYRLAPSPASGTN